MSEPRRKGRPRDVDIDVRVLAAARELLEEVGFAGATMQAIAQRAGVQTPAIYRRWPNRLRLIEECVFPGLNEVAVRPTGDLKADLERFVVAYHEAFAHGAVRTALPGLIAAYHADPDSAAPNNPGYRSARPQFRAILDAAPAEEIDPAQDPDALFDMLLGAVLYRTLIGTLGLGAGSPDHTVEMMLRLIRPPGFGAP